MGMAASPLILSGITVLEEDSIRVTRTLEQVVEEVLSEEPMRPTYCHLGGLSWKLGYFVH